MTFTEWFANLWGNLFPSSTDVTTPDNTMTRSRTSTAVENLTFPSTINYTLATGLYYNTVAGYKLGAHLCHNIISIPAGFMGFPHFDVPDWDAISNKEFWEEKFDFYNNKYIIIKQQIQDLCRIAGTIGIYPVFDLKKGFVRWLFIKPNYISKIITDLDTEEITGIITSVDYQFYGEDGIQYYFTEEKTYTEKRIITRRKGHFPSNVKALIIRRNPTGKLPVFFTNDREPGDFEGHSEFERVLPIIKAYSQVNLSAHEQILNLKPKLIQEAENYKTWMDNNGFADITDVSIENVDFIVNKTDVEHTEIIVPQNLVDNHLKILHLDFWGTVQGSGIPEICWGLKMEGNHASAQEQMGIFLSYIGNKQSQIDNSYSDLISSTMQLEAIAYNQQAPESILNVWDDLDSLTEVERSEIWKNYADGCQKLIDSNAINLQGVHELLIQLTGGKVTSDFDDFEKQITEYGTLRAFLLQDYAGMRDFEDGGKSIE